MESSLAHLLWSAFNFDFQRSFVEKVVSALIWVLSLKRDEESHELARTHWLILEIECTRGFPKPAWHFEVFNVRRHFHKRLLRQHFSVFLHSQSI